MCAHTSLGRNIHEFRFFFFCSPLKSLHVYGEENLMYEETHLSNIYPADHFFFVQALTKSKGQKVYFFFKKNNL